MEPPTRTLEARMGAGLPAGELAVLRHRERRVRAVGG